MADELRIIPEGGVDADERRGFAPKTALAGFVEFVRERGVMGLAIGFVLGSAVQKVVTAFVTDMVNPFVGLFLGRADGFKNFAIGQFLVGDFVMVLVDFFILCFIIYAVFKLLGLEKLDKAKA
ncbi:MAG: MscL family protein [Minisyncoccia bacterium]